MGSQKCRIVGKSQPVIMMINPMIFTRTRTALSRALTPGLPRVGHPRALWTEEYPKARLKELGKSKEELGDDITVWVRAQVR
jgi:hypothetical protein